MDRPPSPAPLTRQAPSVLHVDMDAFYAAVEQQHKPSLRGKPVVVGGVGLRGVVSTASYEARAFGVRSAVPTALARRLCPNAAYLYPRFAAYHAVSTVVMQLLRELSPLVEPVSLDEAFVDLAAMPDGAPRDIEQVRGIAEELRSRIARRTGLTASVGGGTSKLIAKVASDAQKPDGCVIVPVGGELDWLDPLPVRALWGVGPATADRLRKIGVGTVAELRVLTESDLVGLLGTAWGGMLFRLARGMDARAVEPERPTKSISAEDTYPHDLADRAAMRAAVTQLAERVVRRLRSAGHTGRTVTVKARGHDFTTVTRSETFGAPTDDERLVVEAAIRLLDDAVPAATASSTGIRLLGVGISGLADYAQGDLVAELARLERALGAAEARAQAGAGDGGAPGDGEAGTGFAEPNPAGPDGEPPPGAGAGAAAAHGESGPAVPAVTLFGPVPVDRAARRWLAGQDVRHAQRGPGWVQGAGVGRVTVRFEGPDTGPGRIGTFRADDPDLEPLDAGEVAREALRSRQSPA
ncbi:DNA polymerase IV [Actinocrinis puniceicyclus]|uniref:DNA polymerase IV n=1 Tax=Actinocrinis puniceicyclus TaxID=977794 RepID=A0A8J8BCZ6_9ACTN|nr:DNA polymerase IV [Actinocrinis puniceicyclus]MBS2964045.1 DNA polymerase IV [Actinocrinis puniceicyclus]